MDTQGYLEQRNSSSADALKALMLAWMLVLATLATMSIALNTRDPGHKRPSLVEVLVPETAALRPDGPSAQGRFWSSEPYGFSVAGRLKPEVPRKITERRGREARRAAKIRPRRR